MLCSNFLHLITSLRTALVTQHSLQRCYITMLRYMSATTFNRTSLPSPEIKKHIPKLWFSYVDVDKKQSSVGYLNLEAIGLLIALVACLNVHVYSKTLLLYDRRDRLKFVVKFENTVHTAYFLYPFSFFN